MIGKIRWCYCCEEPRNEYEIFNGVYICNDCKHFILDSLECCINCGGKQNETIKVGILNARLYENKRCLNCNQSYLLGEL